MKNLCSANSPYLISEVHDFVYPFDQDYLRECANSIPENIESTPDSLIVAALRKTIEETQRYLTTLVSCMSLNKPAATKGLVINTCGLDLVDWVDKGFNSEIPNYPVIGYISFGYCIDGFGWGRYGCEPAISLAVDRKSGPAFDPFLVEFSVGSNEDLHLLLGFIEEAGELWARFESVYGVRGHSTQAELLAVDDNCMNTLLSHLDHLPTALAKQDGSGGSFSLYFKVNQDAIHEAIMAAIPLLNAFDLYSSALNVSGNQRDLGIERAMLTLKAALPEGVKQ